MNAADEAHIARLVLEEHPAATIVVEPGGRVVYANAAGEELFSDRTRPLERLDGWSGKRQSLSDLLTAAASSSNWAPLRLICDTREVHARARGVPTRWAPNVLIVAATETVESFAQRTNKLNRLNEELASRYRAEARMEFALDAAGIGIWEFDVLNQTTWRSDRHDAIFGYATQLPEWTLESFIAHVGESDRTRIRDLVETAISQKVPYRLLCQIRRSDGELRWIRADGAPLLGPHGDVIRLNGVVSDITEAREAELRVEAAQRMDSLGQMAGGLAHDFANIIGIVRLQAEVALLTRDTEAVWSRLEAIQQAANRGADLAARTLAFARREPGAAQSVALRPLVDQVMDLTFGEAIGTIAISTDGIEDVSVHCDPGQLENALLNLTFNARDAMAASDTGDRITVTARRLPDTGTVEIDFTDNGPGMKDAVLERAADPFFTTKEGSGGTGLGLSSVAAFCTASGGSFDVRSTPGQGTTVRLTLPEARTPDRDDATAAGQPRAASRPLRLLLVEDMSQFREAMELMLTTLGHQVTAFDSAAPALEALQDGISVDILLTDIMLPGDINGLGLAKRAAGVRPDLGIVYMSGYADEFERDGAPRGAFLRKPVDSKDLSEALGQVCDTLPVA